MQLEQKINNDIKEAMLSKNSTKLGVLRMVKTSMTNLQKESGKTELTDEETLTVLRKEVKKRRDSVEAFTSANRTELADKEKQEIDILSTYLPQSLTKEELDKIVKESIAEAGATTKKQMGMVMKLANSKAKGRVDGKTLSSAIQQALI